MNIVPVTSVTTVMSLNPIPGLTTTGMPPAVCDSSAIAMPSAWNVASSTVP